MLPHFAPKKSHFKAKLACFLRRKHVNYFFKGKFRSQPCITHTKPTKNEVKIFVWCTLQQTRFIFFCLAQGVEFSDELKNELKVKGNSYECIQLLSFFSQFCPSCPHNRTLSTLECCSWSVLSGPKEFLLLFPESFQRLNRVKYLGNSVVRS